MRNSDNKSFRNQDNSFNRYADYRPDFRKWFNRGFVMLVIVILLYAISQQSFDFNVSLEDFSKADTEQAKEANALVYKPFHAMAYGANEGGVLWVFSFSPKGEVYLTIINPVAGQVISQDTFPFSTCESPFPDKYKCLRTGATLMGNKIWFGHKEQNMLRAFDVNTGVELVSPQQLIDKYGILADGIFKLNMLRDGRCFFTNKAGEGIAFFPFSEKMGLERSNGMKGKMAGSVLKFIVNDDPGKSDVYVTDAKQDQLEGNIYFAWDYDNCRKYKGMESFYRKEINGVKKLRQTFINPKLIAENGSIGLFVHDKEFGNQHVQYLEALDVKGNSLWKDSSDLVQAVLKCKEIPAHHNPHYKGPVAVVFDEDSIASVGLRFDNGKVLWRVNQKDVFAILNPKT